MLLENLYLCFLSKGFPALVMHSNANGNNIKHLHVSYLIWQSISVTWKLLSCCCSAGDVPLSFPGDEVNTVLWTGHHFIAPIRAKFTVKMKFQLDPLKVSSKALVMFLNAVHFSSLLCFVLIPQPDPCVFLLQHTSHGEGRQEVSSRTGRSGARCRNSIASCADEQPHIGNYRLLKTIGKGNFAKVKLARHILTGREVKWYGCKQQWVAVGVKVLLE